MEEVLVEPTNQTPAATGGNKIWKQLLALAFAGLLLWLTFRGTDFGLMWSYARQIEPLSIFLVMLSALISHILRAWRWIFLLKPLSDKPVSLWNSFCAVMFGNMVNLAIPRGGEIARLISISKTENLPWAGVLPTMFIDRLLDLAMLGILLGMTLNLLPKAVLHEIPLLVPGGTFIAVMSVVCLLLLPKMSAIMRFLIAQPQLKRVLPPAIVTKVEDLAAQFEIGTKSLSDMRSLPIIAITTPAIWFFYCLNNWILIVGFHLTDKVSPLQNLVAFTIGSMGVLVPTPGSAGSFHFLMKNALVWTCGLNPEQALSYATVLHIVCFVLAICIPGLFCWLVQVLRNPSAKK